MNKKQTMGNILVYVILILVSITMLVPFLWMILTAFKTVGESTQVDPFIIFPSSWRFDNFQTVITTMNFPRLYFNTLLMIVLRILCAVLTATFAGYAFARLDFPGKNFWFGLVLFQMMVPVQLFIIPQYVMVSKLGWTNTIWGLLFPGLVTAFGTFLLRQTYMSLPKELEEAARLDGCNIGQTFILVIAPLAKSSMMALAIFTAVFAYKDLMWPIIVAPNTNNTTLASALAKMQGQFAVNYPQLMAAALIACLPMIVLYIIFQKQFIEGIATSGGKL
ncbi:MAG: carbohydrate ABC transporter permease [Lachnospiraceae bacterium]|nr:carbohydrate ABC transporter permease [Lachnospiraceae bacterium]MBQ7260152.1 carbohydrate ABC transporter permease [Lachnospiraceae bacterium]HAV00878.1 sugar ABC transporter permease [Lachnospiraceae bacterium]